MIGIGGVLQGVMVSFDGNKKRGGEEKRDIGSCCWALSSPRKLVVHFENIEVRTHDL